MKKKIYSGFFEIIDIVCLSSPSLTDRSVYLCSLTAFTQKYSSLSNGRIILSAKTVVFEGESDG